MSADPETQVNEGLRVLCDRAAEDAVLGACLINPDAFALVRAVVGAGDFYIHRNRWIFEAMDRLWSKHDPIDVITVACEQSGWRCADYRPSSPRSWRLFRGDEGRAGGPDEAGDQGTGMRAGVVTLNAPGSQHGLRIRANYKPGIRCKRGSQ